MQEDEVNLFAIFKGHMANHDIVQEELAKHLVPTLSVKMKQIKEKILSIIYSDTQN